MAYVETNKEIKADLKQMVSLRRVVRLFTNDRRPRKDDTGSDYVEPDGGVYNRVVLTESDWTIKGGEARTKVKFFADEPVHGFFMTDDSGRVCYGAERFRRKGSSIDVINGVEIEITVELERKG